MTSAAKKRTIVYHYTNGCCGILAVALHEASGFELVAVKDRYGNVYHWGVRDGDFYWDIRGRLTVKQFLEGWTISTTNGLRVSKTTLRVIVNRHNGKIAPKEKQQALADFRALDL